MNHLYALEDLTTKSDERTLKRVSGESVNTNNNKNVLPMIKCIKKNSHLPLIKCIKQNDWLSLISISSKMIVSHS